MPPKVVMLAESAETTTPPAGNGSSSRAGWQAGQSPDYDVALLCPSAPRPLESFPPQSETLDLDAGPPSSSSWIAIPALGDYPSCPPLGPRGKIIYFIQTLHDIVLPPLVPTMHPIPRFGFDNRLVMSELGRNGNGGCYHHSCQNGSLASQKSVRSKAHRQNMVLSSHRDWSETASHSKGPQTHVIKPSRVSRPNEVKTLFALFDVVMSCRAKQGCGQHTDAIPPLVTAANGNIPRHSTIMHRCAVRKDLLRGRDFLLGSAGITNSWPLFSAVPGSLRVQDVNEPVEP
ncbi:hypothetical protein B0T10DRAFT_453296 [Thelonectria olida]|uniref:Uncharacterized protein n=1 Tax=Thelonectria olida TaxID=1576542 RepID=A0A9P8WJH4_9HYPO|nr:hypothetical protein B0T10DRAFT_453296 [Thelonectria olida]